MTVARIFTPENRLASILQTLDAPTASELVADADTRVTQLGAAIRAYVAAKLEEILAFADKGEDVLFAECRTLADAAINVAEVAGAAGMEAIGEVARGISAMVDGLVTAGIWHSDALKLHLEAMVLLNQERGASAEEERLVIARLRAMRSAIGIGD